MSSLELLSYDVSGQDVYNNEVTPSSHCHTAFYDEGIQLVQKSRGPIETHESR